MRHDLSDGSDIFITPGRFSLKAQICADKSYQSA